MGDGGEYNWPLIWGVLIAVGLYWAYCIYWSVVGYKQAKSLAGWGIAGRTLPAWLFMLAASVTSFSAWTYMGHPGTVYAGGIAYAFAGLYAITIPFTGALFLKRQWMIGRHFGFITPPEQYRTIFDSYFLGVIIIIVSFLYSCFYVAVQLIGSARWPRAPAAPPSRADHRNPDRRPHVPIGSQRCPGRASPPGRPSGTG
jgi:Na+/proline symporter